MQHFSRKTHTRMQICGGGALPKSLNRRTDVAFRQLGTFTIDGLELRKTAAATTQAVYRSIQSTNK